MPRIIAISGKSGCGNSTVSKLLAERLGLRLINYTFRNMAVERGIPFEAMLQEANKAKDFALDRELDLRQTALARAGDCVIGSRLAIWLLPEASLKVFLAGTIEARAARIFSREGSSLDEKLAFTAKRDREDHDRYQSLYGIDNDNLSLADLVINTEKWKPEDEVEIIVAALDGRK